ncbi:MAG: methionyl-tRNA formyltransferase [Candidatus Azotimanducaceae bacterium]|jgi:methionyl-tRNA formyltransferase
MKIAFFGTPEVASDTFEILFEHGVVPTVVVTNPDAPRGRKHTLTPTETKQWALSHDLPVLTPEKIDEEVLNTILDHDCDYAIVVAYGKILPEKLIQAFPKGVLNIHYSLLPKYRGASPVESALLNNDEVTGVTIQQMVKALDAGPIVAAEETEIQPNETTIELRARLIGIGAELLVKILPSYENGQITPIEQDSTLATHVGKIQKEDGQIELDGEAQENWNKYRAYAQWPGTFFFHNDKRIKITKAELTPEGSFQILRVIPEGKKETDYSDFIKN